MTKNAQFRVISRKWLRKPKKESNFERIVSTFAESALLFYLKTNANSRSLRQSNKLVPDEDQHFED